MTPYTLQSRLTRLMPLSAVCTARERLARAGPVGSTLTGRSNSASRGFLTPQRLLQASWRSQGRLWRGLTSGWISQAIHSRKNSKRQSMPKMLGRSFNYKTCPSPPSQTGPTARLTSNTKTTSDASELPQGRQTYSNSCQRIGRLDSAQGSAGTSPSYPPIQSWATQATTCTRSKTGWTTKTKA